MVRLLGALLLIVCRITAAIVITVAARQHGNYWITAVFLGVLAANPRIVMSMSLLACKVMDGELFD
jgi:hypothetical protein